MNKMKILNLYCGIGGNRKLWKDVEVTAVEYNEEIAAIYQEYFPQDKVIVGDAHEYLLKHYREFDFIWSSPPCQSHSMNNNFLHHQGLKRYPDMKLYQEIIYLKEFAKCKWVVENVKPYYEPLIKPTIEQARHLFWSNFKILPADLESQNVNYVTANDTVYGFSFKGRKINHRKDQILRNCVNPELGLYILEQAQGIMRQEKTNQLGLFNQDAA
jgi:DNA (cytosine-5)-methyltransferase 1